MGICKGTSTEKCDADAWCRGYCAYHYNQWRAGNLDVPFVPVRPPSCTVEGCDGEHIADGQCHFGDGPHRAKGLCSRHYFRNLRGTPFEPVRAKGFAKLTPDDVRQIRHARYTDGQRLRTIADQYGMSIGAISQICTRRTWADVD